MAGTNVKPSKSTHGEITLDLSAAAGPVTEERQEDDQDVGKKDGQQKRGGGWGRGEARDSDVPSKRISPLTLLSYKWGYHLCWPQRQGERRGSFFFFFGRCTYIKPYWSRCTYMVKPLGCIGEYYAR